MLMSLIFPWFHLVLLKSIWIWILWSIKLSCSANRLSGLVFWIQCQTMYFYVKWRAHIHSMHWGNKSLESLLKVNRITLWLIYYSFLGLGAIRCHVKTIEANKNFNSNLSNARLAGTVSWNQLLLRVSEQLFLTSRKFKLFATLSWLEKLIGDGIWKFSWFSSNLVLFQLQALISNGSVL